MAETVRKNLGMVTAYAYAVSKGYSGTEEEFAELMASYADVAQDAETSAQAAAQSATTAEQKATQAAGSATSAAESADDAEASAQMAAGSSNSASLYAQNASASATNAVGAASSASTYAGNASASAQGAEGSANAAEASATNAAGSATTATAKAGEAATSATTAVEAAQRAEDAAATLVIDDTLTHAGQAADAKKTGDEIGDLKENIIYALPKYKLSGGIVSFPSQSGGVVQMQFTAQDENRIYCGGRNLCDGQVYNVAPGSGTMLVGSSFRSLVIPIKGGYRYTIGRTSIASGRFRFTITGEFPVYGTPLLAGIVNADSSLTYTYDPAVNYPEAKYLIVYLSNSSEDVSDANYWCYEGATAGEYTAYNGTLQTISGTTARGATVSGTTYCWCDSGGITVESLKSIEAFVNDKIDVKPSTSNTGNFSIVCAKEHSYTDGTAPVIEYFLIEECLTQKFYITKDFQHFQYIFTFNGKSQHYSYGILANGDIIACKIADALPEGKDDSHRANPYCWLANENWVTQHEVTFTNKIAPCGWLSNCGFRVLANDVGMFVEYTRMTVATANVWRITGSPVDSANWNIVKSFTVTTENNSTGFKHIHMVIQDFYTGAVYFSTGDDNDNAMIWASVDDGLTWSQIGTPSQMYCRNLMFTFTKDYIYWAPDTTADSARYLFKATRDTNGVMDFSSIENYIYIGGNGAIAAYGTAYIPELNAILILDRSDGATESMPLKIADLLSGTCATVATLYSPSDSQLVGFRTRFSEWYPHNGKIRFGFNFYIVGASNNANHIKGFDNAGNSNTGLGALNINNLVLQISKNGASWNAVFDTMY